MTTKIQMLALVLSTHFCHFSRHFVKKDSSSYENNTLLLLLLCIYVTLQFDVTYYFNLS